MESTSTYVLGYWALAGFVCSGLFANVNEADLSQHPQKGWQTPLVRTTLYFAFGGILLPMVVLVGGAVNAAALLASFVEGNRLANAKTPERATMETKS
ncbi:MAG: hypothetical protein IOD12_06030 [Silvanigrellales bacterium]|nr:hypothetical protein [Silvanigrellales bacterium]